MIGQANSVRPIGLDLSRSSESDNTVTKCRPPRAYMRVIYTPIYVIRVIYALERFILNIFCVNIGVYTSYAYFITSDTAILKRFT